MDTYGIRDEDIEYSSISIVSLRPRLLISVVRYMQSFTLESESCSYLLFDVTDSFPFLYKLDIPSRLTNQDESSESKKGINNRKGPQLSLYELTNPVKSLSISSATAGKSTERTEIPRPHTTTTCDAHKLTRRTFSFSASTNKESKISSNFDLFMRGRKDEETMSFSLEETLKFLVKSVRIPTKYTDLSAAHPLDSSPFDIPSAPTMSLSLFSGPLTAPSRAQATRPRGSRNKHTKTVHPIGFSASGSAGCGNHLVNTALAGTGSQVPLLISIPVNVNTTNRPRPDHGYLSMKSEDYIDQCDRAKQMKISDMFHIPIPPPVLENESRLHLPTLTHLLAVDCASDRTPTSKRVFVYHLYSKTIAEIEDGIHTVIANNLTGSNDTTEEEGDTIWKDVVDEKLHIEIGDEEIDKQSCSRMEGRTGVRQIHHATIRQFVGRNHRQLKHYRALCLYSTGRGFISRFENNTLRFL